MGYGGMEFTPGQPAYPGYGGAGPGAYGQYGHHGIGEAGDNYTNELPPPPPAAVVGPPPPRPNQRRMGGGHPQMPNENPYNSPMYPQQHQQQPFANQYLMGVQYEEFVPGMGQHHEG